MEQQFNETVRSNQKYERENNVTNSIQFVIERQIPLIANRDFIEIFCSIVLCLFYHAKLCIALLTHVRWH